MDMAFVSCISSLVLRLIALNMVLPVTIEFSTFLRQPNYKLIYYACDIVALSSN